jgi:hypothetical protein
VKRHLFNLMAAISVLLFLATAAMWVRSFFHMDEIVFNPPNGYGTCYILAWNRGIQALNLCDAETNYDEGWSIQWAWERLVSDPLVYSNYQSPIYERLGFSYQFVTDGGMPDRRWTIPHWSAVLLLSITPGIWLFHVAQGTHPGTARTGRGGA